MFLLLFLTFLAYSSVSLSVIAIDFKKSNTSVWLSGYAYCDKNTYNLININGFQYTDTLYDTKTDVQGFVGYSLAEKTIYVVIRGTSSVLNWIDDLEIKLVNYDSYPSCNCLVHNGFYKSALAITNATLNSVFKLTKRFPNYEINVAGHSYGAAVAQLLAMELAKHEIKKPSIYNFGQPRVGDDLYAGFVNTLIQEYWRFTHNRDVVPHAPPISIGYIHSCREVFENANGKLEICSETNCEDDSCANQYALSQTNIEDHMVYLGHRVSC